MIGIYKITSPTGKVYIGQSWNIEDRVNLHYKKDDCKGQIKLYSSIKKYGWDSHKFEIIHELPCDITQSVLDNYETIYWQQYKDCAINMLNIKEPGKGGKHSDESKQKMSESQKRSYLNSDRRQKLYKKISQFSKDGKLVRHWESQEVAARCLSIKPMGINANLRGITKTAYDYIWRYYTPSDIIVVDISKRKHRTIENINRPIFQYDLEWNFIKEWRNATIAAEKLGLNKKAISSASTGKTKSSGKFFWKRPK